MFKYAASKALDIWRKITLYHFRTLQIDIDKPMRKEDIESLRKGYKSCRATLFVIVAGCALLSISVTLWPIILPSVLVIVRYMQQAERRMDLLSPMSSEVQLTRIENLMRCEDVKPLLKKILVDHDRDLMKGEYELLKALAKESKRKNLRQQLTHEIRGDHLAV